MQTQTNRIFNGVSAANGCVIGPYTLWHKNVIEEPALPAPDAKPLSEAQVKANVELIEASANSVAEELYEAAEQNETGADILFMTAEMAKDPAIIAACEESMQQRATSPERAVWEAYNAFVEQLTAIGGYLGERAQDLVSVRDRIVGKILGISRNTLTLGPVPTILVAENLEPADTATLNPASVLGIITAQGGPTSHTAILARALGIPAVVGAPGAYQAICELNECCADAVGNTGAIVALDGSQGQVVINPDPEIIQKLQAQAKVYEQLKNTPVVQTLADGTPVSLLANIGNSAEAIQCATRGAKGVGLFRTEFAFLSSENEPSVTEQAQNYRAVFNSFGQGKIVLRTLDAGSDKPLPFLTMAEEENPALGVRGLRTARKHLEVLERQLEAVAKADSEATADVWVMAPMIATLEETRKFVATAKGYGIKKVGIMVETPAAALKARNLMEEADFLSIGTNDLTQYTMAADRQLGDLADLNDPWQPAVLQLIALALSGAREAGKPAGICGEAAADPLLAAVLLGMGATYLSVGVNALGPVSALLSRLTQEQCNEAARLALAASELSFAKAAVREYVERVVGE